MAQLKVKLLALCFTFLPLGACTTNLKTNALTATTKLLASNPLDGNQSGTFSPFTNLNLKVVKNIQNPGSVFDIYGDDGVTPPLGDLCASSDASLSGDPTSASICECQFSFSTTSRPSQQVVTPVIYHEPNLIRCSYSLVPSDATLVHILIHVTTDDTASGVIDYTFGGSNTFATSVTLAENFVSATRYQCRDLVVIPYMFDSTVYDPIQSEDPHLTYPIDFYASSLGNALSNFVDPSRADATTYWQCPPILNPDLYLAGTALSDFKSAFHLNMNVYSKAALAGGGTKIIYPPDPSDSVDRSTFYVSKTNAGVFTLPIDSVLTPGLTGSLGYGARPIPTVGVAGSETCPDVSVIIPSGFKWMKLWLFRASLPQRHFATSGANGISAIAGLYCNPGDWDAKPAANPAYPATPIFPDCFLGDLSSSSVNGTTDIAYRVVGSTGQCVNLTVGGLFDSWTTDKPAARSCDSDLTNTCSAPGSPTNFNVVAGDLDSGGNNAARYDFLFVVSPPSITLSQMLDTSASSPALQYQPYRYFSNGDCSSPDPDSPTPGDCDPSNAINNYGLKLHDVGSNGDPPQDDANRAGVFPVCVLQKT